MSEGGLGVGSWVFGQVCVQGSQRELWGVQFSQQHKGSAPGGPRGRTAGVSSLLHRGRWRSGHPLALQPPRPGPAAHVNAFPGISAGPLEGLCRPHLPIPQGGQSWGGRRSQVPLITAPPQHSLLLPLTVTLNGRRVCNRNPRVTTPAGLQRPRPWAPSPGAMR